MKGDWIERVRQGLKERDAVIEEIYLDEKIKNIVIGTLVKRGCDNNSAIDYFGDAIINFVKACYRSEFQIKSSLPNYLTTIAKNLWLKEVTKKDNMDLSDKDMSDVQGEESTEVLLIKMEQREAFAQILDKLDVKCRKILMLWASNYKMSYIAEHMNYRSEMMARKKKHQCMKRLNHIVEQDPSAKEDLRNLI